MTKRPMQIAGLALLVASCATGRIGDPSGYTSVPLNRVVPYPSADEVAGQKTEVIPAVQYTSDLPEAEVSQALVPVQNHVERYLTEAGAGVIDRSIHDIDEIRDELEAAEAGSGGTLFTGADWALVTRMRRWRHWSSYEPPSSLFKDDEELEQEPGECTHHGEVEVDFRAFEIPTDDVARTTFRLQHRDDFSEKSFDPSCPIPDARRQLFLEDILADALPCLERPIKNRFAPHGYIEEHRRSPDGKRHIVRTTLGSRNGAKPGLELAIIRVQYMTAGDGNELRDEHKIGSAVVSDQIRRDYSWIILDPAKLEQPILAGDLVRAVYRESRRESLGFGRCGDIFSVVGESS